MLAEGLWVGVARVWTAANGAVVSLLLARLLEPQTLGRYFLLLSVATAGSVGAQLGLGPSAVRGVVIARTTGASARIRSVVSRVCRRGLLGALAMSTLITVGGRTFGLPWDIVLLLAAWQTVLTGLSLAAELLRGFHDIRGATFWSELAPSIVYFAALIAARVSVEHVSLTLALAMLLAGGTLSLVAGCRRVARRMAAHTDTDSSISTSEPAVFAESWPNLVTNLVWLTRTNVDIWILSGFRPVAEVAAYGVVSRVAGMLLAPQNVSKAVIVPQIVELHLMRRKKDLELLARRSATLCGMTALAGLSVFVFAGGPLLMLCYGAFYSRGETALIVLGVGQTVGVCMGLAATTLIMTGHPTNVMWVSLCCTAVAVAAALALARTYGMVGVAAAMAAGTMAQNGIMLFMAKRRLGVWTHTLCPRIRHS